MPCVHRYSASSTTSCIVHGAISSTTRIVTVQSALPFASSQCHQCCLVHHFLCFCLAVRYTPIRAPLWPSSRVRVFKPQKRAHTPTCPRRCNKCKSTGKVVGAKCNTCGGHKVIHGTDDLTIEVEPGMDDGHEIVFPRAADQSVAPPIVSCILLHFV
jgi:hypothetical protein